MKINEIEIERELQTPAETEMQGILRRALELLGPNGERWGKGAYHSLFIEQFCAIGAVRRAVPGFPINTADYLFARRLLDRAINNIVPVEFFNDRSDFPAVRAMFERAIILAADA